MNNFIYFVAGGSSPQQLKKYGLGHAIAGRQVSRLHGEFVDVSGQKIPGQFVGFDPQELRFEPDKQTWVKDFDQPVWVGWWNDRKPGPADLLKDKRVPGKLVTLGDERAWEIPTARTWTGGDKLPGAINVAPDGRVVIRQVEDLVEFAANAERLHDDLFAGVNGRAELSEYKPRLSTEQRIALLYQALMINYAIGRPEINALKLIDCRLVEAMYEAIIDLDLFRDVQAILSGKKNDLMSE